MKFTAAQSDLSQGLGIAARAVSSRNTLPILSGILLKTDKNRLQVAATDLEVALQVVLPAQIEEEGQIVLPARYLTEIIRRLPAGPVHVEVDASNYTATFFWERSHYTIHGQAADQFPQLLQPAGETTFRLGQGELRNLIRQTIFAASHDETRPILTGACFSIQPGLLEVVATDGVRIAFRRQPLPEGPDQSPQRLVIPARSLNELLRLLTSADASPVTVHLAPNQIFFDLDGVTLASRLLEGQYPDVLRLVPKQYETTMRLNVPAFHDACERASLIAREGSNAIKLSLSDAGAVITSNTPEVGQVYEELAAALEGSPLEIGLNPRFLADGLRVIDAEELVFEFSGSRTASRMRPAGKEDFFYVVLPIVIW